jgi:hypothetical protein
VQQAYYQRSVLLGSYLVVVLSGLYGSTHCTCIYIYITSNLSWILLAPRLDIFMCLDVFVRVNTIGVRLPFVWKFRIVTFVLWSLFMCTSPSHWEFHFQPVCMA